MSTQILIKRSTTTGAVPTTSDIATGELAINTVDKRIFTNNSGTIVELGTTPTTQAVTGNASVGGTFDVVGAVTVGNFTADGTVDLTSATVTIPAPTADTHPATKKYVDDEVNAILDGAPAALDTLNEIAAAINDDANLYTTLTNSIATKLSLSGGTMTGSIDMGANSVTTSVDPATANTLTRKSYVDGLYQSTVDAEVSAANALASEQAAATSTSNAATSASASATSATASASSATNAASSATAAASSATSSANSATASATSATQSAASATQAQALVDSIESFYLGAEASAPTVDDNGDPLQAGDWYFNTTDNATYIYNGSSWQSVSPDVVADLTPQLGGDLDTNGNDINFGDNDKAIFGAGSDLQIYHDGSNSYISEEGTGSLAIRAENLVLQNSDSSKNYGQGLNGGAFQLNYDGVLKLATTSTGIDVTGTATMDGLTVDGGDNTTHATFGGGRQLSIKSEQLSGLYDDAIYKFDINSIVGVYKFSNATNTKDLLKLDYNGDISFYEDTGTTAKFFWDASAESLGIGTSSPNYELTISSSDTVSAMQIINTATGSTNNDGLLIYNSSANATIANREAGFINFETSATERMRIDSSGNLLVGTTSTAYSGNEKASLVNSSGSGLGIKTSGATQQPLGLWNTESNGDFIKFAAGASGTSVGSIGVDANDNLYLAGGTGNTKGIYLNDSGVMPATTSGSAIDNAVNLGAGTVRFKDLYLSGGVYLGGTGSANHLDDYEEGTWTPAYGGSSVSPSGVTYDNQTGYYTKIGNTVVCHFVIGTDSISSIGSGSLYINGLPFTQAGLNNITGQPLGIAYSFASSLAGYIPSVLPASSTIGFYSNNNSANMLSVSCLGSGGNSNRYLATITYQTA